MSMQAARAKTSYVRATDVEERWLLFDASEHTLGRMANQIAMALMGKDRPQYQPNECTGAHVVVIHSEKAVFSGKKDAQKTYQHYSGYTNGRKVLALADIRERRPNDIVTLAVRRMLPKTRLGRTMLSRLKVYSGGDHPHTAQKPTRVDATLTIGASE